jgi:hypothetical protein
MSLEVYGTDDPAEYTGTNICPQCEEGECAKCEMKFDNEGFIEIECECDCIEWADRCKANNPRYYK